MDLKKFKILPLFTGLWKACWGTWNSWTGITSQLCWCGNPGQPGKVLNVANYDVNNNKIKKSETSASLGG